MLLSHLLGGLVQLEGTELEALPLEAADDFADKTTLHAIGLDHHIGNLGLDGHGINGPGHARAPQCRVGLELLGDAPGRRGAVEGCTRNFLHGSAGRLESLHSYRLALGSNAAGGRGLCADGSLHFER